MCEPYGRLRPYGGVRSPRLVATVNCSSCSGLLRANSGVRYQAYRIATRLMFGMLSTLIYTECVANALFHAAYCVVNALLYRGRCVANAFFLAAYCVATVVTAGYGCFFSRCVLYVGCFFSRCVLCGECFFSYCVLYGGCFFSRVSCLRCGMCGVVYGGGYLVFRCTMGLLGCTR